MTRLSTIMTGALLAAAPLSAQATEGVRSIQGFWVGAGVGAGQFTLSCTGCSSTTRAGFAGDAAVGYAFSPSWHVAVQFSGTRTSDGPTDLKTGAVSFVGGRAIPGLARLFATAGVGLEHIRMERGGSAPSLVTVSGLMWQVGLVYEQPLAPGLVLAPALTYSSLARVNATIDDAPSPVGAGGKTVCVALGLDWHWAPVKWHATDTGR